MRVIIPSKEGEKVAIEGAIPAEAFVGSPSDPRFDDPLTQAQVLMTLSPFEIECPGVIKVRAFYGDEEIKLGSLLVERAPQPDRQE